MRLTVFALLAATGWLAVVNAVPVSFDLDDNKPDSDLLSQAEFSQKRLQRRAEDNAASASTSTASEKSDTVASSSTEKQTAQAREVSYSFCFTES